jgi:hypothetical protein
VFGRRVARRIFGPKREKMRGNWRNLRNEELYNLYSSPNVVRMIESMRLRRTGHVVRMGETRNAYRMFFRKPEGKRPLGKPRLTTNLKYIGPC